MSAYKQFTTKDIVITPFSANKGFGFSNVAEMTASNVGIEIYYGTEPPTNKLIFSLYLKNTKLVNCLELPEISFYFLFSQSLLFSLFNH